MSRELRSVGRFGAFEGVFVPTTLTILGVILFVRSTWVVGQVGLGGALLIVCGAYLISTTTALSVSSIVTNVRVEGGGAFALLARTLGIEPGGSIGLPLFLTQALAVAMYLFGFREGWRWIFPEHPAWAVDLIAYAVVFGIAGISARLAFRIQYAILAIVVVAVGTVVAALIADGPQHAPTWWAAADGGEDADVGFWAAFAVFFPAVTGIMAGVNMSGELRDPGRSIIRGTLTAIAATFVVYVAVAIIAAVMVPMETLRDSKTALIDLGAWSPLVLAGLLAATFSSALTTAVGAPRILQALGAHRVVPFGRWVAKRSESGEPHRALAVTAAVVGLGIALRDLNAIAPLITLFFLLTYGAINATLLLQQGLELPRFRPTFRVPLAVPALGTLGCLAAMYIVSPAFTSIAIVAVIGTYAWLARRPVSGPFGQVRAGMVFGLLSWVVGRLTEVPSRHAWQAHVVLPVADPERARGVLPLAAALARRGGSVRLVGLGRDEGREAARALAQEPALEGTISRWGAVECEDVTRALEHAVGALDASLVPPNLLLLPLDFEHEDLDRADALGRVYPQASAQQIGLWLVDVRARGDGDEVSPWSSLRVWIERDALEGPLEDPALALVLLGAWRLHRAWGLGVTFAVAGVGDEAWADAQEALHTVVERARIPGATTQIVSSAIPDHLDEADEDRLHLVVLRDPLDREAISALRERARGRLVVACRSGRATAE